MQLRLLPSTIGPDGRASAEQHLTTLLIDDRVAVDAGSLALSGAAYHAVRDIIITHPHLDHTATLPIFIDDLFGELREPVRVHTTAAIAETLEKNIFNWMVYPRFLGLRNAYGPVMEYVSLEAHNTARIAHLTIETVPVTHGIPTLGLIADDGERVAVFSSDTAATDELWRVANRQRRVDAVVLECSFPNEMGTLAHNAGHLTPETLAAELRKLDATGYEVFVMHLKPAFREKVVTQLQALDIKALHIMEAGRAYCF